MPPLATALAIVIPAAAPQGLDGAFAPALHAASHRDLLRTLRTTPGLGVVMMPTTPAAMSRLTTALSASPDARVVLTLLDTVPTLSVADVQLAIERAKSSSTAVALLASTDGHPLLVAATAGVWRGWLPLLTATAVGWSVERVFAVAQADAALAVQQLPGALSIMNDAQMQELATALMADPVLHAPATRGVLRRLTTFATTGLHVAPRWPIEAQEVLFESPRRVGVRDHTRTPHGAVIDYTYLITPDAVRIVAVTSDAQVVFVRQYRVPIRDWSLEVPAGGLEPDEDVLDAAARELLEEVGGTAGTLQVMGGFPSSTAHLRHYGTVVLALDVALDATPALEATEDLVVVTVPVADAFDMARAGDLGDAESALALLMCESAITKAVAALTRAPRPES